MYNNKHDQWVELTVALQWLFFSIFSHQLNLSLHDKMKHATSSRLQN